MKILVIGAGPAGLSAALNAARDGHETVVFEKNNTVCAKTCGEALAREALDYIDMKPSNKFIVREVNGFRITFRGDFIKEARFGNLTSAPGYLIDKPSFLETLLEKVEKDGAEVYFNSRVEKVNPETGKMRLQNGEMVQGDLIICADGSGSVARSYLDYSNYDTAIGIQYRCSLPEALDPTYLHLDIIGEGYAWTFVKQDYANVGLGLPRKSRSADSVKSYLDKYVEKLGVKPLSKAMSAPVSTGGPLKSFATGKMVVAGEAAGCVMPLSGEGNRFGIYGGSIAYKPNYRSEFMKKYGRNMKTSRRILELVMDMNDDERISFLKCLKNPLETLEGKLPKIGGLFLRPRLLIKMIRTSLL